MRVLEIVSNYTLIVVALFFFVKKYFQMPGYIRYIGYVLLLNCIVEGIAAFLMIYDINNLFLFHILNPIQFAFYAWYTRAIMTSDRVKNILTFIIPVLVAISFIMSFSIQSFNEYNSYWLLIHNIFITLFILYYFYEQSLDNVVVSKYEKCILLINIGLFIYSIGNLFIGGFLNILIKDNLHVALLVYFGSVIISYIMYLFFIMAFIRLK